ncbi:MAG: B12-binding domain-containing radical SAM protein [Candidatus Omnitrophica bacterium]|nr:B12-binding domain-containing radical SAM protein [Candidatus Omnitrophota bacterium]
MKILLVKPLGHDPLNNAVTHPLGLMYLAAYLRRRRPGRDTIRLLDMRLYARKRALEELSALLSGFRPDIVGISGLTTEHKNIFRVANLAKELHKGSLVIAGGPHSTSYPQQTMECRDIDYAVQQEGEETFFELIETLEKGLDPAGIPGLSLRKGDAVRVNQSRGFIEDVDSLPFPAWDLIEVGKYSTRKRQSPLRIGPYMSIYTSRGCPFGCVYCHNIFGKAFRARSVDNILAEMQELIDRYSLDEFDIVDDIFNFDRERASHFFEEIIKRRMKVRILFPNGLRADLLDEEVIALMKEAGVVMAAIAIESASPRIQKLMNKNINLDKTEGMIKALAKQGIATSGFFMLGFPTEKKEELKLTLDFALRSHLAMGVFFMVIPFAGTQLGEGIKNKSAGLAPVRQFDYFSSTFNLSGVGRFYLFWFHKIAWLRFYLGRRRMGYFLKHINAKNFILAMNLFLKWIEALWAGTYRLIRCNP